MNVKHEIKLNNNKKKTKRHVVVSSSYRGLSLVVDGGVEFGALLVESPPLLLDPPLQRHRARREPRLVLTQRLNRHPRPRQYPQNNNNISQVSKLREDGRWKSSEPPGCG